LKYSKEGAKAFQTVSLHDLMMQFRPESFPEIEEESHFSCRNLRSFFKSVRKLEE
jgi:hypothetical protein